jgi:hypothetical protein
MESLDIDKSDSAKSLKHTLINPKLMEIHHDN